VESGDRQREAPRTGAAHVRAAQIRHAQIREDAEIGEDEGGEVTPMILTTPARRRWLAPLLCGVVTISACGWRRSPPPSLTDAQFSALIESLSEPPGSFTISDNLVSNEPHVAENARRLRAAGGVYIGVGPEQNYSYIARARPAMAFVVDIRRENLTLHLFYKALFELSSDRADFVARLFSRPRPPGLDAGSSANDIFERFDAVGPSAEQVKWNAAVVRKWGRDAEAPARRQRSRVGRSHLPGLRRPRSSDSVLAGAEHRAGAVLQAADDDSGQHRREPQLPRD
jgi:hypothetical protein